MKYPTVIVPAGRYFAGGGVFNGWYTRCSDFGVRARAFSSARPNGLRDTGAASGGGKKSAAWLYSKLLPPAKACP